MIKNDFTRLLLRTFVFFVIFCSVDYILYSEFRFLRNIIIGIPVSTYLFFIGRKQGKEKK